MFARQTRWDRGPEAPSAMPSATADERIPAHSSKPSAMAAVVAAPREPEGEERRGDCFEKETPGDDGREATGERQPEGEPYL